VLSALAFVLIAYIVPDIHVTLGAAFVAAIVAGLVNALVRPILILLTLPITILTLGLFLLVLDVLLFWLIALLVPGFSIGTFWAAVIGALLYWLFNMVINTLFERRDERQMAR
jgi:putative membrane protein